MVPTLETSNMQLTQITIKSSSKCFTIVRKNDLQPRILHSGILAIKYEYSVNIFTHMVSILPPYANFLKKLLEDVTRPLWKHLFLHNMYRE